MHSITDSQTYNKVMPIDDQNVRLKLIQNL